MKLLIGGSPCTHWSIAQTKNRETEASGIGWELFLNYCIARDKYKPDYFLYENNKSMSPAIRTQITAELGVEPVLINSALLSAQNRQRLYWVGKRESDDTYSQVPIEQPEDRGILLRDILETGVAWREKSYTLDAHYYKSAGVYNPKKQHSYSRLMAAEPIRIGTIENDAKKQAELRRQLLNYGALVGQQFNVDMMCLALNEEGFGHDRIMRIIHRAEKHGEYFHECLAYGVESDARFEQLDQRLRYICRDHPEDFMPREKRYPNVKVPGMGKNSKRNR